MPRVLETPECRSRCIVHTFAPRAIAQFTDDRSSVARNPRLLGNEKQENEEASMKRGEAVFDVPQPRRRAKPHRLRVEWDKLCAVKPDECCEPTRNPATSIAARSCFQRLCADTIDDGEPKILEFPVARRGLVSPCQENAGHSPMCGWRHANLE
jgi:hypothetical protein